jgi:hypothetical protein
MRASEYAHSRGLSPQTVRRWIRNGAPCARRGRPGPGGETLVDPGALDAWRGLCVSSSTLLETVATALWDVYFRDAGDGEPAWRSLGIERRRAATLLVLAYRRIARTIAPDVDPMRSPPAVIVQLLTICQNANLPSPRSETA